MIAIILLYSSVTVAIVKLNTISQSAVQIKLVFISFIASVDIEGESTAVFRSPHAASGQCHMPGSVY